MIDRPFNNKLTTKEDCYNFIAELMWAEGYSCKKSDKVFIKEKQPASLRSSKCGYDKSTTTGTLFHKLKFGINKAFEMMHEIVKSKKWKNSIWLAEHF